jgi:hypothetical protein
MESRQDRGRHVFADLHCLIHKKSDVAIAAKKVITFVEALVKILAEKYLSKKNIFHIFSLK